MAKKTATEKADKADKTEKGSTSGEKGAGDKTPVENTKESEEQPVELGKLSSPLAVNARKLFDLACKTFSFVCSRLVQNKLLLSRNFFVAFKNSYFVTVCQQTNVSRSENARQSFNELHMMNEMKFLISKSWAGKFIRFSARIPE